MHRGLHKASASSTGHAAIFFRLKTELTNQVGVHIPPEDNESKNSNPDVHSKFIDGYHVVRRSDRFWAGLSSDLVTKQV